MPRIVAAAFMALLAGIFPERIESGDASGTIFVPSGTMFYASCMAAADEVGGRLLPSDRGPAVSQLEISVMCIGAITALMHLEPYFKPEFAMCPPQGDKISYAQAVLVIAAYLRQHAEKLHENFYLLSAFALHLAWPCPEDVR